MCSMHLCFHRFTHVTLKEDSKHVFHESMLKNDVMLNHHEYACMSTQVRQQLQRLAIEQQHFREADQAFEELASVDDILSPEEFENIHGTHELPMETDSLIPQASEPGGPVQPNPDAMETLPFDPLESCLVETRFTEDEVVEIAPDTPSPATPTPKTPSPRGRLERTETEDKELDPKKKINKSDNPAPGKELSEKVAHTEDEKTKDVLPEGEVPNAHEEKAPDMMSKEFLLGYEDRAHDHLQPLSIMVISLCHHSLCLHMHGLVGRNH